MVTDGVREHVRQRANHRCEYCQSHQKYVMGRLQVDHIIPVARGGSDDEENLCLACKPCNQHKWAKIYGTDPLTEQTVKLYNPRQQRWDEHFIWSSKGDEIYGLTICGRATVIELRLNNEIAVTVRRNWVQVGWHPPGLET